ncbi:MAG: organomercurial lyase [Acidiferrobacterales bacterium]
MPTYSARERASIKNQTLGALLRLRTAFPLEQRIADAPATTKLAYGHVLSRWLEGRTPPVDFLPAEELKLLSELDAIVPGIHGIGCYPFSACDSGIRVHLEPFPVYAMCAIDALAVARVARRAIRIEAPCGICGGPVVCEVEADGSLRHDQTEAARVIWRRSAGATSSCSDGLCRDLVFVCRQCRTPPDADCLSLPQAAAVANAFFGFQRRLISPKTA